jgi:transcription factor C subunit 3
LKKDRLSTIVSLTDKFRRAFLKAYEKNEVPPIDFNNVLAYDWKFIIKWTTKLDMAERLTLPSTRKALDKTITVTKFKHGNRPWREAFYHPQRSIFNKFQDATSESLAYSVDDIPDPKPSTEMIVAMSWTRSLCVTPVEAYTADAVLYKRNSLFPSRTKTEITELMVEGVDQLQRQAVISKSSSKWSNGRRWRFNTRVLDAIEKAAQQEKFAKAVQFKKELDQAFRAGEKKRVTYITNDGMVMALINMQASGRVRVETTGQPHVPMGHEPGNYETRKYTKKYMHFRLDIVPTGSYLYDDDATTNNDEEREDTTLSDLRNLIKNTPPPTMGPRGAVPVWCDVFGKVDAERWLKYLSAVLITLASRGSMRAAELAETLKPVIMEFEAELIMEWAGRLGLLRAQFEGAAPAVMEWWWIVVGVQREGLVEAAAAAKVARQRKALPSGRPSAVAGGGGGGGGGRGVEGVEGSW